LSEEVRNGIPSEGFAEAIETGDQAIAADRCHVDRSTQLGKFISYTLSHTGEDASPVTLELDDDCSIAWREP
jgi:hypothetical protein